MKLPEIWPEEIRSVLLYSENTGVFTWRVRVGQQRAGTRADAPHNQGYRQVSVFGRMFLAHRLAWFYVKGVWPDNEIDHKNRIRDDNKFSNLREATRSKNGINGPVRKNNTSGHIGVSWSKDRQRWVAQIVLNKKCHILGRFVDMGDAIAARKAAELRLHGEFTPDLSSNG